MRAFSEQTAGSQLGASHTGSDSDLEIAGLQGPPFLPSTSTAEWGSAGKPKGFTCIKYSCDFVGNKHFGLKQNLTDFITFFGYRSLLNGSYCEQGKEMQGFSLSSKIQSDSLQFTRCACLLIRTG